MNIVNENPLVSIIMGSHNCEKTLASCIRSILSQTYTNWEFIICDDCSTDETYQVLLGYQKEDKRFVILHNEENKRLAASLNRCLEVARGKYIARMDADDECYPQRLERQVQFMETHPEVDVVGSNSIVFDGINDVGIRKTVEYPTKEILLSGVPFMHPTIMMKRTTYEALGGYTVSKLTRRSQDLEMWFRFYQAGFNGYNLQEPLYRYREGAEDYKRRTLKTGFNVMRINYNGFKKIAVPWWKYFYIVKPLLAVMVPRKWIKKYHDKQLKEKN